MSHLRPLTVTWSSGDVGVGDNLEGLHTQVATTSCSVHQHRCPLHSPPAVVPADWEGCPEAPPKQEALGARVCCRLGCQPLSGSACSQLCVAPLCVLWFDISFLHQLGAQQLPAWLLKIPVSRGAAESRRSFQDQSSCASPSGPPPSPSPPTLCRDVLPSIPQFRSC